MKSSTVCGRTLMLLLVAVPALAQHHMSNWVYRSAMDTTVVPCWTDSLTMISLPPSSMSMMMPASMFMRIDRMPFDSLIIPHDSTYMGWYRIMVGSDSTTFDMMNSDSTYGSHNMMQFMMSMKCQFHWDSLMADSAHRHWHPTGIKGWNGSTWSTVTGASISGSIVSCQSSQSYSAIAFVGASSVTTVIGQDRGPTELRLMQNYPNPFNPSTSIEFTLPRTTYVRLDVYNTLAERVATLVNGIEQAGLHSVRLDASALPSGVYFYRLTSGELVQTNKMTLVK